MQHLLIFATFLGITESQDFLGGLSGLFGGGGGGGNPFGGIFQQVAPAFQNPAFQNVFAAAPQFFQQPQPAALPQLFQTFMKQPAPPAPSAGPAPSSGGGPAPVPDASDYDQPIPIGKEKPTTAPPPKPAPAQQGGSNYDDIDYSLTGANTQG